MKPQVQGLDFLSDGGRQCAVLWPAYVGQPMTTGQPYRPYGAGVASRTSQYEQFEQRRTMRA